MGRVQPYEGEGESHARDDGRIEDDGKPGIGGAAQYHGGKRDKNDKH